MTENSYKDIPGEWNNEPDYLEFVDEETGYQCEIKRNPLGILCGYVVTPEDHPLFGTSMDDLSFLDVHWGVSWANIFPLDKKYRIGFDCAHSEDFIPGLESSRQIDPPENYRNIEYVKAECKKLAKQLKEKELKEKVNNENNNTR